MLIKTAQNIIYSLLNLGWSVNAITHQAGVSPVTVINIKNGKSERITSSVAEKLQALFESATEMNISVLDAGPLEKTAATPTPPAKKKPGRKPQPKTEAENAEQAPKKRGRPKKAKSDMQSSASAPKKRGRKPKSAAATVSMQENVISAPKKRGRPPRSAQTDATAAPGRKTTETSAAMSMIRPDGTLDMQKLNAEIAALREKLTDLESVKQSYLELIDRIAGKIPF